MRTRFLALALLALIALPAGAEYRNQNLTLSTTSTGAIDVSTGVLWIVNNDTITVYVRVFEPGDDSSSVAATSANIPIVAGASLKFTNVAFISAIAASGTPTINLIYD